MPARILLVDDDPGLSEVVELLLTREGYMVACAGTVKAGLERLRRTRIDLVITDLRLPDGTGLDAIGAMRRLRPELPIIMITSFSSLESAIGALRAGAVDYIVKPFDNDDFLHGVARALNERRMTRENALLKRHLQSSYGAKPLIGESPGMRKSLELIRKSAPADASVLIRGESGTGKELAAAAIHYASARAEAPFITIHCGMLPRDAQESEIFGHDADGGTLFLDEITELAPAVQIKLLDVLEERTDEQMPGADVRYIGATQRDIAAAVERGQFRRDLYYRLSVISIEMPPLRERGADRLLLARDPRGGRHPERARFGGGGAGAADGARRSAAAWRRAAARDRRIHPRRRRAFPGFVYRNGARANARDRSQSLVGTTPAMGPQALAELECVTFVSQRNNGFRSETMCGE